MKPVGTNYLLATRPNDYSRCAAMMQRLRMTSESKLSFPTILAIREDKLLGFLSTQERSDAVVCGPLVLEHRSPIVAIRLLEAYDVVMRRAGVSVYLFTADTSRREWISILNRLHEADPLTLEKLEPVNGQQWYKRMVTTWEIPKSMPLQ